MNKIALSAKISKGVKNWHAKMSEEDRLRKNRKISQSMQKRHSEMPPRMKKDINEKKKETFGKFIESYLGREQRDYLGYLLSFNLSNRSPEEMKKIIKKQVKGQKRAWRILSPEEKQARINKTLGMKKIKERQAKKECFFEFDVPRIKNYCGVVTCDELERMHG